MHVDLQKTFPDMPCVSQMFGGPSLRLGVTKEGLNIPSGIGCGGKDTGRLVTWEFPLRTDSASWKSLESLIQFTSFCNSCTFLLVEFGVLLLHELLGVRDDRLYRDIPR